MNLSKKCKICAQLGECGEKKFLGGGEGFKSMYKDSFFCKKSGECGEIKNFSPLKTANLTKIHRFHRIYR